MRSRWNTLQAAAGLVGAVLQGGRGGSGTATDIERTRQGPIADGFGVTDVYRPRQGASGRAAILMVHGLTEDGPDDNRIPTFASTAARGGMPVVVPEFRSMRGLRMRIEDTDDVASAAAAIPGAIGVDKVVLLAFSYAAGPTLLAASRLPDELIAGSVAVGAYYDLDHVLEFTATGKVAAYGKQQPSVTHDPVKRFVGQWVFLASAGRWLDEPSDREVLDEAAAAWDRGEPSAWEEVRAGLTEQGSALLDSITRDDAALYARVRGQLPAGVNAAMQELTLRDRLDELTSPVVLIHGRHDVRIPYRESILLRDAIRGHTRVKLAILNAFVHAQRAVGWSRPWRVAGDAAKLGRCGLEILGWSV